MRELNEREVEAVEETGQVIVDTLAGIRGALIVIMPGLIRLACAAVALAGAYIVFNAAWSNFGGDLAAMIPAFLLAVLPLGTVLTYRLGFGGLLFAGLAMIGLAFALPSISPTIRNLALVAVVAAIETLYLRGRNNEAQ